MEDKIMLPIVKTVRRSEPVYTNNFFNNDDVFSNFFEQPSYRTPEVNILENDNEFVVEVAAPGLGKDDFAIVVDQEVLTISSENKNEEKSVNGNYLKKEFYYGNFKRSFGLPETVDSEKINATHENGILNVSIPKKEEAKPKPARTIKIS